MSASLAAGIILVTLGAIVRTWALLELRAIGMKPEDAGVLIRPPRYTDGGPYGWIRHPAYLGSELMIAGVGVAALGWAGVVLVLPAIPFFQRSVYEEERIRRGS